MIGGSAGVRCDLAGDVANWRRLLFHVRLDGALPVQLAELARLRALLSGDTAAGPRAMAGDGRAILVLRTIDALGEGASLRDIGLGIAGGDEWPGEGEWVKSRARRLVAAAEALWGGGPRAILARGSS